MSMDFRRWLRENGRRSKWGPWTKNCLNKLWRQWDVGYLLGWQDLVWDPGFWCLEVQKCGLCLGSPNKKEMHFPREFKWWNSDFKKSFWMSSMSTVLRTFAWCGLCTWKDGASFVLEGLLCVLRSPLRFHLIEVNTPKPSRIISHLSSVWRDVMNLLRF